MKLLPLINDFRKIAIIQTAFVGDIALALPLAEIIKRKNPRIEITFISTPAAESLLKIASAIDKYYIFDKKTTHKSIIKTKQFATQLREEKIDCVISAHRSARTALLTHWIEPCYSIGFDTASLKFLYKNRQKYIFHSHEIMRNLNLLKAFNEFSDERFTPLPLPSLHFADEDVKYVLRLLENNSIKQDQKIILIAPGSVWNTKKWLKEYFIWIIKLLFSKNITCILIGSGDDKPLCDEIACPSGSISFAGQTTISQTVILMQKAAMLLTNDSGPVHFAWLAGCPTVAIFGPTSPMFGFAPTGEYSIVIENTSLNCRPCEIHGSKQCPLKTHECMKSITPDMVYEKIIEQLSNL